MDSTTQGSSRRTLRHRARAAGAALLLAASMVADAPVVHAGNWGAHDPAVRCTEDDPLSQCAANNANPHNVYMVFLNDPELVTETQLTMSEDYNPSSVIQTYVVTSLGTEDVRVYNGDYGTMNGARAWTTCEEFSQHGLVGTFREWCKPQLLFYNRGHYPLDYNNINERRHITCHDIGHTHGLRHTSGTSSCMYNGDFITGVNPGSHAIGCIEQAYTAGTRCP
jgi:hypothetical protein